MSAHTEGDSFDLLEAVAKYLTRHGYHVVKAGGITVENEDGERRLVVQFTGEKTQ